MKTRFYFQMKERYSLKRRAFGPAETLIRSIVNSCREPTCKFNVISHSKQRINTESASLAVVEESKDITDLSASSVQGHLETIGLNSVSPSKNAFENGDFRVFICLQFSKYQYRLMINSEIVTVC